MRTRVFQNVIVHRLFSSGTSYNIFMSYETVTTKTKTKTPQRFVHQKYACSILSDAWVNASHDATKTVYGVMMAGWSLGHISQQSSSHLTFYQVFHLSCNYEQQLQKHGAQAVHAECLSYILHEN